MANCVKCGRETETVFRALSVETFHNRDLSGEKRVQALGDFQEFGICRDCADARLKEAKTGVNAKKILPYAIIFVIGIVLAAVFWKSNGAFRLVGLAGIVCGVLGVVSVFREEKKRTEEYARLDAEHAYRRAAWEAVVRSAPKKDGDNDVTYIPVTEDTMKMKNGDLMIVYNLLPAIAKQAWNRLHGVEDKEEKSE